MDQKRSMVHLQNTEARKILTWAMNLQHNVAHLCWCPIILCVLRALQRVPPPLPEPGHLWRMHDADHPREHLLVGHPQPSHQAGHLATLLTQALRTRCHPLHLRGRTVRLGGGGCKYRWHPSQVRELCLLLAAWLWEKTLIGTVCAHTARPRIPVASSGSHTHTLTGLLYWTEPCEEIDWID